MIKKKKETLHTLKTNCYKIINQFCVFIANGLGEAQGKVMVGYENKCWVMKIRRTYAQLFHYEQKNELKRKINKQIGS